MAKQDGTTEPLLRGTASVDGEEVGGYPPVPDEKWQLRWESQELIRKPTPSRVSWIGSAFASAASAMSSATLVGSDGEQKEDELETTTADSGGTAGSTSATVTSNEWSIRVEYASVAEKLQIRLSNDDKMCEAVDIFDKQGILDAGMSADIMTVPMMVERIVNICRSGRLTVTTPSEDNANLTLFGLSDESSEPPLTFVLPIVQLTEAEQIVRLKARLLEKEDRISLMMAEVESEVTERKRVQSELDWLSKTVLSHGLADWSTALKSGWRGKSGEKDGNGNPMFLVKLKQFATESNNPLDLWHAKYLFAQRRTVSATDTSGGWNALHICAQYPSLSGMLDWFLKDGSIDPKKSNLAGSNPLHIAAEYGNVDGLDVLLRDRRVLKDKQDGYGRTPMIIAVVHNQPSVVLRLIKQRCDTKKKDHKDKTALDYAHEKEFQDIVEILEVCKTPRDVSSYAP